MTCVLVRRHVGALVDGELDPGSLLELERHIDACAPCQERVVFERHFRSLTKESFEVAPAPALLRARLCAALDDADRAMTAAASDQRPLSYRSIFVLASAAATVLLIAASLSSTGTLESVTGGASRAGMLDDIVRLHSSGLPSDISTDTHGDAPRVVSQYFRNKVQFPVRPTEFERQDVRLVGARLSNVREQRAAALFYDVRGARMTVVVFEGAQNPVTRVGFERVRLRGHDLLVRDVHGYPVPVRQAGSLHYAFTGDLDRSSLIDLAASARVTH